MALTERVADPDRRIGDEAGVGVLNPRDRTDAAARNSAADDPMLRGRTEHDLDRSTIGMSALYGEGHPGIDDLPMPDLERDHVPRCSETAIATIRHRNGPG